MNPNYAAVSRPRLNALEANKVLKNTYLLLSATLAFSAVMAMVSMAIQMPPMTYMIAIIASMVLGMFVLPKTANSSAGVGVIFLITGLLGFGLGSILTIYMAMANGPQIVATALGGTGIIFLGLSGYALTSKKDFSFLGGFLFAGMMVIVLAIIASLFVQIPYGYIQHLSQPLQYLH
jgi:modulator of FtsH protease